MMHDTDEQSIRERAYALWQKEGSPEGRHEEFWERARLMAATEAAPAPMTPLQQRSPQEAKEDHAVEQTFPASDPVAAASPTTTRTTKA